MVVKKGDKVKVEYTGMLEDGTVFDSTERHGQPLEFEAGSGKLIKGFDNAVIGMKKGDEKTITIKPEEAYGHPKPQLIKKMPREKLPPEVKAGMMLLLQLPNGAKMPVKVMELSDKEATIDLNHPLAGKTLKFKIKIADITT